MNSLASKAGARSKCVRRLVIVPTVAALLLWVLNSSSRGQEARDARPIVTATATVQPTATSQPTATAQPTRDFVDLLKLEAERSDKALQAYTDLLREEANRSEQATRHEIDVVERTLAKFIWIVGIVGTIISGVSAIVGGTLVYMGLGSLKDIERKVANAANTTITAAKNTFEQQVTSAKSAFANQIADVTAASSTASEEIKKMQGAGEKMFNEFESKLGEQQSTIKTLTIIVRGILTEWEYEKLQGLARQEPFLVRFHKNMLDELYRLRALGYVTPAHGRKISSLRERDGTGEEFDLKEYIQITAIGKEYVKLREETLAEPSNAFT
jgi:hypothetical protein